MNKKGFTLIELIISLAISVIILSLGSISFNAVERHRIVQSANILRSNLRYCQKNAVDEKRKYVLTFDSNKNSYYVRRADDSGLLRKVSQINLPLGINIFTNAKENSVAYTLRGTTGSACTINLRGQKYFLKMTVNVGCGRVKINPIQKLYS